MTGPDSGWFCILQTIVFNWVIKKTATLVEKARALQHYRIEVSRLLLS